jgi:hypothetical protein
VEKNFPSREMKMLSKLKLYPITGGRSNCAAFREFVSESTWVSGKEVQVFASPLKTYYADSDYNLSWLNFNKWWQFVA